MMMGSFFYNQSNTKGFTLVEVMITLAVIAIILMLALPSFSAYINHSRARQWSGQLLADFQYARSEAMRLKTNVLVCASNDGTTCIASSSGNLNDWSNGWIVLQKAAFRAGSFESIEANDKVLLAKNNLPSNHFSIKRNADFGNSLVYFPSGLGLSFSDASAGNLRPSTQTFNALLTICAGKGNQNNSSVASRVLSIKASGAARSARPTSFTC